MVETEREISPHSLHFEHHGIFFFSAFFTSSVQFTGGAGGVQDPGDAELFFPASIAGGWSESVKWTHKGP